MSPKPRLDHALEADGFRVQNAVIDRPLLDALLEQITSAQQDRRANKQNLRNAFEAVPLTRQLVSHPKMAGLVEAVLGHHAFAVRAIVFDKTPDANWRVAWHQDTAIPLAAPAESPGFGPPSTKDHVPHTRAPASLLERMLTVRLHLDDCTKHNGPLRVIPGSHRLGRLDDQAIEQQSNRHHPIVITVPAGGALLMRPLLLHASSPATHPAHRRVLHLEFAAHSLPNPLRWHTRFQTSAP